MATMPIRALLKSIIPKSIRRVFVPFRNFYNLGFEYGQFRSIMRWECVDKKGEEIPWYTYPAIEYLNNIDFSEKIVFEFGGGNSTIWWAKRALKVITVENDKEWYDIIKSKAGYKNLNNIKLILKQKYEDYVNSIVEEESLFDVVVIDGKWRSSCARSIKDKLNHKSGFIIILDNADWYPKTSNFLIENYDTIRVDFHGFAPLNPQSLTTSIFISRNCHLKFRDEINFSICSVRQVAEDDEI